MQTAKQKPVIENRKVMVKLISASEKVINTVRPPVVIKQN